VSKLKVLATFLKQPFLEGIGFILEAAHNYAGGFARAIDLVLHVYTFSICFTLIRIA